MAVVKSTPPRPMRAVRLRQCTPLDRWLASVEMKTSPELYMDSPLPDDHAMVELYMYVFKVCPFSFLLAQLLNKL